VNAPPERPPGDAARGTDHYFSASPQSSRLGAARHCAVRVNGIEWELALDRGVFNGGDLDWGTRVLLENAPPPPDKGTFCDLGCGSGAIAAYLARVSPAATIWAVDVNERARDVARATMMHNGITNVTVCAEDDVPHDVRFDVLWSNPPIRVGKDELHRLLSTWLARLAPDGVACLVAHKNLGSDSLARWLTSQGWNVERHSSKQGYRVLVVRR
jgi:16S rRNA G1207 methylase RsmC